MNGNDVMNEYNNLYKPSVFGVGFLGQGKYKCKKDGKITKEYKEWNSMIERGFSEIYKNKYPSYKDVIVDEYFYNFQNYGYWREQNYYEIEGERMELDKDILIKNNKIYAPDKCIFVPQRINYLFTKHQNARGNYPIGVTYDKRCDKYIARCNTLNDRKYLGRYNTPEEAFLAYKEFKEAYIKEIANEYKERIPNRLYEAMYEWKVEITD